MSFYDEIADQYSAIVDQGPRREAARQFVAELTTRTPIATALDIACGTGLYATALAEAGIAVTASDLSEPMLDRARQEAPEGITFHCGPMQTVSDSLTGPFDAIVCMGNSLPHLLTDADLAATLGGAYALLAPGGVLAIQLLNYDRILEAGERMVGITRVGDVEHVRFYDFLEGQLRFNLLTIRWAGDQPTHELHSTILRPYGVAQLAERLSDEGFENVESYAGLNFEPLDQKSSDTILLITHKPLVR